MARTRAEPSPTIEADEADDDDAPFDLGLGEDMDDEDDGLGEAPSIPLQEETDEEEDEVEETRGDASVNDGLRDWSITHNGDQKLKAPRFITSMSNTSGSEALLMFQERRTMDYGAHRNKHRNAERILVPHFYLDFISIVGKRLAALTLPEPPEGTQTFDHSFQLGLHMWGTPYSAKHIRGIDFDIGNRTFCLGKASSRELWFIVMHPIAPEMTSLNGTRAQRRTDRRKRSAQSAVEIHHAIQLSRYIKTVFTSRELLGEGIERGTPLGQRRSQTIGLGKWAEFQRCFVEGWPEFREEHKDDTFWTQHEPAFHAYDYGANTELPVAVEDLDRMDRPELQSDTESEDASDDERSEGGDPDDQSPLPSPQGRVRTATGSPRPQTASPAEEAQQEPATVRSVEGLIDAYRARYDISSISHISYAIATCISEEHGDDDEEDDRPSQTQNCLLADRRKVAQEYRSDEFTFYPMGFHPRYGNFSSPRPPGFLDAVLRIIVANGSSDFGANIFHFGQFHGYTNIKRSIRHSADDLLATKGIATGAMTLPKKPGLGGAWVAQRREALIKKLTGAAFDQIEGESPTRPFAREADLIENAIRKEEYAYRMEQVVSVDVGRIASEPGTGHWRAAFSPVPHIMRFFCIETDRYERIFATFPKHIFPGVLVAFGRLFDLAVSEIYRRFTVSGADVLDIATAEGTAALDRLGNFCFTGDCRVLPSSIMRCLGTMESLDTGGWPFINPAVLSFSGTKSPRIDFSTWPRSHMDEGRAVPKLLHIGTLCYYYGKPVGLHRQQELLFDITHQSIVLNHGLGELAYHFLIKLWVDEMRSFMYTQIRRRMRGLESQRKYTAEVRKDAEAALDKWDTSPSPFTLRSLAELCKGLPEGLTPERVQSHARQDYIRQACDAARMLGAAKAKEAEKVRSRYSTRNASWFRLLGTAMQKFNDFEPLAWEGAVGWGFMQHSVEWVPGVHTGRLTAWQVAELKGRVPLPSMRTAAHGTLKRKALDAIERDEETRKRASVKSKINFGMELPFQKIPKKLTDGLDALDKDFATKPDRRTINHYHYARDHLVTLLGTAECDLMLMLALTISSCSQTVEVAPFQKQLSIAPKTKQREATRVAFSMVVRMMWSLCPDHFTNESLNRHGAYTISEMAEKMGHRSTCNSRMLRELGWIVVNPGIIRDAPKFTETRLQNKAVLRERCAKLKQLLKHPDRYIADVFRSADPIWVDRCGSIISSTG